MYTYLPQHYVEPKPAIRCERLREYSHNELGRNIFRLDSGKYQLAKMQGNMKRTDWFLFAIVAGVIVLVATSFVVALSRPEPSYKPEETAEDVAHNYLFALQQADLERAYSYISPTIKNYPVSSREFTDLVMDNRWMLGKHEQGAVTMHVESSMIREDLATVYVRETNFYARGLFDSGQNINTFSMKLQREESNWKIVDSDEYWLPCLHERDGCN